MTAFELRDELSDGALLHLASTLIKSFRKIPRQKAGRDPVAAGVWRGMADQVLGILVARLKNPAPRSVGQIIVMDQAVVMLESGLKTLGRPVA